MAHPNSILFSNMHPPHFCPFYYVEINKENMLNYKDFALQITTLIVPFTLREVSMYFLLGLNEDFDDDLLMDTVDLIA